MKTIADSLRQAILESGKTCYRISQDTGISESNLSRFMHGKNLSLSGIQILADYLGCKLIQVKSKKQSR